MSNSPSPNESQIAASISTRFNLDQWDIQGADVLFLSTDEVFFYAHQSKLLQYSANCFGGLIVNDGTRENMDTEIDVSQPMNDAMLTLAPKLVVMNISSDVLNVILLALYHLPIQTYQPSSATLREVIPSLVALGYDPETIAFPHSELCRLLLKAGAADPLAMYAVAAQYSFESLAVAVSALTLKVSLCEITDELAQQMGTGYLRRLFFLHLGRADALKRIILPQPSLHPPDSNPNCDLESQKSINRAWTLSSAYIMAQDHPGEVGGMLAQLGEHIQCAECRRSLEERVSRLVHDWSAIKCTI